MAFRAQPHLDPAHRDLVLLLVSDQVELQVPVQVAQVALARAAAHDPAVLVRVASGLEVPPLGHPEPDLGRIARQLAVVAVDQVAARLVHSVAEAGVRNRASQSARSVQNLN